MGIDCLKCINSACCKLVIEVDKEEYDNSVKCVKKHLVKRTDAFIKRFPKLESKRNHFDEMYKDNFATLEKSDDGLCVLLDRKTMLCSVYEDRPKCCKDYTTNRCSKIRECIN